MPNPKIYTLNCSKIIGTLGPETFEVLQRKCPECNRTITEELRYSKVEYLFDEYNGEDMFAALGAIIISESLYKALHTGGIKGFAPIKVTNGKSRYFTGKLDKMLRFFHLGIMPPEVKNIPIAYDFKGVCPVCNYNIMDATTFKPELIIRENSENQQPLQVYSDSWNGSDVFHFADHGEIGITESFLKIMQQFNCPENIIIPAEWI